MRGAAFSLVLLGWLAAAAEAGAGEPAIGAAPPPAWLVFGGLSAGGDYAAAYLGAIVAPSGDLWQPGLRLRPGSAAGFYRTGAKGARRNIATASATLLAGYQIATGDRSLAIYGGAEAVHFARSDPPHFGAGWHLGARVLAEAGLSIDERTRAEGHLAYGGALRRLEAGARLMRRVAGPWRIGPEAAYFDKPDGRDLRLGLALARRAARSGLGAAAGLSLDGKGDAGPYLAIGFDRSF